MVEESNQNVILIQIDVLSFQEFELSDFVISWFDCIMILLPVAFRDASPVWTHLKIKSAMKSKLEINPFILLSSIFRLIYSRVSISRTRISRILRSSKRLSELKIHFDCFLQPYFGVGDFFTSPNYPKCKLICTSGNLNL